MHETISYDSSIVMDSAETSVSVDAVASGGGSTSTEAGQSQETLEDEEATESGSDSHMEDIEPAWQLTLVYVYLLLVIKIKHSSMLQANRACSLFWNSSPDKKTCLILKR